MMRLTSFFKNSFLHTLLRFDLAIIACIALCTIIIARTPSISLFWVTSILCGIPWFVGCRLWIENQGLNKLYVYLLGLPIWGLITYYLYITSSPTWSNITLFIGMISFTFLAPFILRHQDADDVWKFHFHLMKSIILGGIASLILLIGSMAILVALDYLLSFRLYPDQEKDIITIVIGFALPTLIMMGIPDQLDDTTPITSDIILKFLTYIVIPLLLIYGLILHIYSFKIFFTLNLPRGKVSYLVAGYSSCIITTYILAQRWRTYHQPIQLFYKYIGYFMIIPLTLMAWGMWKRISTFGLTEARYLLTIVWTWLILSNFFILTRPKNPAPWIIGVFSELLLTISIGPWSIIELPIRHQLYRLKGTLLNINTHPKQANSKEHLLIISSILDYLETRHRLEEIYKLYPEHQKPIVDKLTAKIVSQHMKIPYIENSQRNNIYFEYNLEDNIIIPLHEYAYLVQNLKLSPNSSLTVIIKEYGLFTLRYSSSTYLLEIYQNGGKSPIYQCYMPDLIQELQAKKKQHNQIGLVSKEIIKNHLTIKIIFKEVKGYITSSTHISSNTPDIRSISADLLLKSTVKK
jgi:hypothetical protein